MGPCKLLPTVVAEKNMCKDHYDDPLLITISCIAQVAWYRWKQPNSRLRVLNVPVVVSGEPMVAVSWQEMMCPSTEQKELRKVAKVA